MSAQEFLSKSCLFILLPALLIYGCLRHNEDLTIQRVAERACLRALISPAVTSIIVVGQANDGHLVYKSTADTTTLRKLRDLAKRLRPVRVKAGDYRPSLRRYSLLLVSGRDTCKVIFYKMPTGQVDLLNGVQDTAYEAPQFIPLLDSMFRFTASNPGERTPEIDQWLSK